MNVTIPDSLKDFVEQQVTAGRYPNADAFVSELIRTEAEIFAQVAEGEPLPTDKHFERRLEVLLEEAEGSGEYLETKKEDFDAMEREAFDLLRKRKSP